MKDISRLLSFFLLLCCVSTACKKDEHQIFLEGGTPPELSSAASGDLILKKEEADKTILMLSWTNPGYSFTTGASSQDVTYKLQIDTSGANFSSAAMQEVTVSKELGINYKVRDLNTVLTKLNLQEDIPHNVEFRVIASLGTNNSAALVSNVVQAVITPYLDVAVPIPPSGKLFITGDGTPSGWTNNPPAEQECTKVSNTEYSIVMNFSPGLYYKFLSTSNQWQPQYGGKSATGGELGYNMGGGSDPDAIPTPSTGGSYKVSINFKTGQYTVVKQ